MEKNFGVSLTRVSDAWLSLKGSIQVGSVKVALVKEIDESMVKKCSECGYENRDEAKFCSNCGTLILPMPAIKPVPAPLRLVTRAGMCFYHPNLPAVYVCGRCGRQICRVCSRPLIGIVLCPECLPRIIPPPPFIGRPAPLTLAYYMRSHSETPFF